MPSASDRRRRIARAIAYRMVRRTRTRPGVMRWTVLVSIWVHLGAVLLLALLGAVGGGTSSREADSVLQVSRLTSEEIAEGSGASEDGVSDGEGAGQGAADLRPVSGAASPRVRQAQEEAPQPPPLPEPVPDPAADPDWLHFVRTEEDDALAEAPDTELISPHDTHSDTPRRAPVTSERVGPLRPVSEGPDEHAGRPTLARRSGEEDSRMGDRAVSEAREATAAGGGGGGATGVAVGQGAPGPAGVRLEGGAAAPASVGGSTGGPGGGISPPRSAPPAPDGERSVGEVSGWWQPMAVRLVAPAAPTAASAAARAPAVTRGEARALVERPGLRDDVGGTDFDRSEDALPEEPSEGVGLRRIAPPGTADPVEELREALGFGPVDRERLAHRPEWPGLLALQGISDSSPQAVVDDVPIAWETSLSTAGTPLGAWVQRAEEVIKQRWQGSDLDPHERAVGLQGQVTVRYLIHANGRVGEVRIARSSGHPSLDEMAIGAIPQRLPRLPRDLRDRSLHHQITLRYRNPLVATGTE